MPAADDVTDAAIAVANDCQVSLLALPDDTSLTNIERAINTLIVNHTAQLNQRAMEIQRQLTRLAAENRDLEQPPANCRSCDGQARRRS